MQILGIILLTLGAILKIWTKLSYRYETRALTPQNVIKRNIEITLIQRSKKWSRIDGNILLTLGAVICLFAFLLN